MGHILTLADEYKVEGVHDFCSKMLRDLPKSKENAVRIFFLSTQTVMAREDDRLESVRLQCKAIVKDMDLVDIQGSGVFKKLNKEACQSLLVERIGRLETHITEVYPQFVGLAEYCLHLALKCSLPGLVKCPEHFINPKVNISLPKRIVRCSHCNNMIGQLVKLSLDSEGHEHVYGGEHHFNSDLITSMKNLKRIMRSLEQTTSLGDAKNRGIAATASLEANTRVVTPLCESKASTETIVSNVGAQTPAATQAFGAFTSPTVDSQASEFSKGLGGASLFEYPASTKKATLGSLDEPTYAPISGSGTLFSIGSSFVSAPKSPARPIRKIKKIVRKQLAPCKLEK